MDAIKSASPKKSNPNILKSERRLKDNTLGMPSAKMKAERTIAALCRFHFSSSTKKDTTTSRSDMDEVSAAIVKRYEKKNRKKVSAWHFRKYTGKSMKYKSRTSIRI